MRWLPLVTGMIVLLAAGFFISMTIGNHFGSGWQWGWMPVEMALGVLVGHLGARYAFAHCKGD